MKKNQIPDPCGNEPGYERIIACFIEQLKIDQISCSATVFGYVKVINTLFQLRNITMPADLLDRVFKDPPSQGERRKYC